MEASKARLHERQSEWIDTLETLTAQPTQMLLEKPEHVDDDFKRELLLYAINCDQEFALYLISSSL